MLLGNLRFLHLRLYELAGRYTRFPKRKTFIIVLCSYVLATYPLRATLCKRSRTLNVYTYTTSYEQRLHDCYDMPTSFYATVVAIVGVYDIFF